MISEDREQQDYYEICVYCTACGEYYTLRKDEIIDEGSICPSCRAVGSMEHFYGVINKR
jgi:formylmethanofuran dehydrogenase subunit E